MRALDIITDAYERCNRLSPGEVLSADDAAFGFRRLTMLVDELSAQSLYLYKDTLTSAAQTWYITLGSGSWAAISPGEDIVGAACDSLPIDPITMQQYNEQYRPHTTGTPSVYAHDGSAAAHRASLAALRCISSIYAMWSCSICLSAAGSLRCPNVTRKIAGCLSDGGSSGASRAHRVTASMPGAVIL